jgi:hypothetical protein
MAETKNRSGGKRQTRLEKAAYDWSILPAAIEKCWLDFDGYVVGGDHG